MKSRKPELRSSRARAPTARKTRAKRPRKVALLELLEALARATNEATTPEAAMRTCLEQIFAYSNWSLGRVAMLKAGAPAPVVQASLWHGKNPGRFAEFMRVSENYDYTPLTGSFITVVLREKRAIWIANFDKLNASGRLRSAVDAGLHSGFAFPIVVQGEVAAFIEFFAEVPCRADPQLFGAIGSVGAQLARLIERSRAEAAYARLAAIVEYSDDAIVSRDLDRRYVTWNAAAERLFGYSAAEAIGQNVSLIIPPDQEARAAHSRELLASGVPVPATDTVRLTKDGQRIDVSITQSPIKDADGRVTGVSLIFRDITERKQAEEKIRQLAHYDSLTELPNRALFYDRLGQAIGLARRERYEVALMYVDLDRFKAVNDTLGHGAGDELLRAVADRIRTRLRESDTIARIGGDEFVAILPKIANREDVAMVARKLLDALSTPFPLVGAGREAEIGASIGIAIFPGDAEDMEALVKAADAAMYEAKQARNDFRFYDEIRDTVK